MEKQSKYGVWTQYFSEGYTHDGYEMLRATARHHADNFMRGVCDGNFGIQDDITPVSADSELDEWVVSSRGQNILAQLVTDMQVHIDMVAEFALPAHDIRQIFFKDAAEGFRFAQMEKPQGYKTTFIIPMNFHDGPGRLLEGRFHHPQNNHKNWIPHSQLSFLLFKDILDRPDYRDIPQKLKAHFLYAVLAHSGDNGKSYMSRAVQACDRMQLIGAEGFFRALEYSVCLLGADIKYPDNNSFETDLPDMYEHKSVFSLLEYFSRNMRENIGRNHQSWRDNIFAENIALLLKSSEQDDDLRARMFAPEIASSNYFGPRKQPIDSDIMGRASIIIDRIHGYSATPISRYEVFEKISSALQSPSGAAQLTRGMQQSLNRAVNDLSTTELCALKDTVHMAEILRDEQDVCDRGLIQTMGNSQYAFCRQIANKALAFCPRPVEKRGYQPAGLSVEISPLLPPKLAL